MLPTVASSLHLFTHCYYSVLICTSDPSIRSFEHIACVHSRTHLKMLDSRQTPQSSAQKTKDLLLTCGGPTLHVKAFECIEDLDSGRLLLEWINSQASDDLWNSGDSARDSDIKDNNHERSIRAAMRDSMLEVDEVLMLVQRLIH